MECIVGSTHGTPVFGRGVEGALGFQEHLVIGHPANAHAGGDQGLLDASQKASELRQEILVLAARTFDTLLDGEAEQAPLLALQALGQFVMDSRIPDEVGMEKVAEIVPATFVRVPALHPLSIDRLERSVLIPV